MNPEIAQGLNRMGLLLSLLGGLLMAPEVLGEKRLVTVHAGLAKIIATIRKIVTSEAGFFSILFGSVIFISSVVAWTTGNTFFVSMIEGFQTGLREIGIETIHWPVPFLIIAFWFVGLAVYIFPIIVIAVLPQLLLPIDRKFKTPLVPILNVLVGLSLICCLVGTVLGIVIAPIRIVQNPPTLTEIFGFASYNLIGMAIMTTVAGIVGVVFLGLDRLVALLADNSGTRRQFVVLGAIIFGLSVLLQFLATF